MVHTAVISCFIRKVSFVPDEDGGLSIGGVQFLGGYSDWGKNLLGLLNRGQNLFWSARRGP